LFTSADLLGRRRAPRAARRVSSGTPVTSYAELEVGGFAVHVDQGIGVYRGLTSREVLGVKREYLLLEYAKGDRLYVPTAQLAKVQRYVGSENPCVHRLRGREWSRSRKTARRSAERTARELFELYLERKSLRGFDFPPDTPWQREMEDAFEHTDTPDQARAAREVKADMESDTPMDRLVCGDVGYGKTEVAVRAAMKAVMDSKQVAVLVPTTVLASQHLETFAGRMAPFPVKVAMLSRFLSAAEQGRVVEGLRSGEVDVVIGTHRMLQDDVSFGDLGLLVVDEEQKFGVANKERLRRLARDVDTLTLTATPIPRTLQMSLSGIRDISVIDTPPEDRRPVATYVGELDMDLALHAIHYEIARGGQVFYVHNRVESIDRVAATLEGRLEGASTVVAHGRMDEDDLERVMMEFADGLHDVLVCTTIIESGLDLGADRYRRGPACHYKRDDPVGLGNEGGHARPGDTGGGEPAGRGAERSDRGGGLRDVLCGRTGTLDELGRELEDRFGPPPAPVVSMLKVERLRRSAGEAGLESIALRGDELRLRCLSGEERILDVAAREAVDSKICDVNRITIDEVTRTLYLKLRLREVNNRQELLLKWLDLIIDAIIDNGHKA
jgi:transcription-repair coupling factor (superfamily II helicase)